MKTKFVKCFASPYYLKFVKKHWWSKWGVDTIGVLPILYKRKEGKFIEFKH